jgi:hypothetical protein
MRENAMQLKMFLSSFPVKMLVDKKRENDTLQAVSRTAFYFTKVLHYNVLQNANTR